MQFFYSLSTFLKKNCALFIDVSVICLVRHLMPMLSVKMMLLELWWFKNGGVLILRSRTMPLKSHSLTLVSKPLYPSEYARFFDFLFALWAHWVSVLCSLYRGKVGLDTAEAQHLMDGLDWPGAIKDIRASVEWLKANGSKKVSNSNRKCFRICRFCENVMQSVTAVTGWCDWNVYGRCTSYS